MKVAKEKVSKGSFINNPLEFQMLFVPVRKPNKMMQTKVPKFVKI